jgi:hypothetical protein
MHRLLILAGLFLLSFQSMAQISTPEKRKFNAGLYGGLSIWKYKPMVSVDLSYRGTTLRLMPNYKYYSVGLTQEITKLSPVFYNLYWTVSAYAGYGNEGLRMPAISATELTKETYTGILSTGLKTYFAKRLYSHVMAGVMYSEAQTKGLPTEAEWAPYFEFGLGINLFKTYPQLKREEQE